MDCDKELGRWEEKKLGDEIELCYGKGLIEKERKKGNIPVFGSNGVVGFHDKSLTKGPGVIIGRKGSVGEVKFSKNDFWAIDTTYFLKLKRKGDIRFWFYFLLTLNLNKMNSHSAVPGLNRDAIYEIKKNIPEYVDTKNRRHLFSHNQLLLNSANDLRKICQFLNIMNFVIFKIDFILTNCTLESVIWYNF